VSRTDIGRDGRAVKIYRRSAPAGGIRDPGLYFLAFSADLDRFDWLLQSMFGLSDDGRRDRLLSYTRPVSGSYFYAPPLDTLRVCLDG
jgi:putative iron-dependent peroxidase